MFSILKDLNHSPIVGLGPAVLEVENLEIVCRESLACHLLKTTPQLLLDQRVLHRLLPEEFPERNLAPSGGLQEVRGVESPQEGVEVGGGYPISRVLGGKSGSLDPGQFMVVCLFERVAGLRHVEYSLGEGREGEEGGREGDRRGGEGKGGEERGGKGRGEGEEGGREGRGGEGRGGNDATIYHSLDTHVRGFLVYIYSISHASSLPFLMLQSFLINSPLMHTYRGNVHSLHMITYVTPTHKHGWYAVQYHTVCLPIMLLPHFAMHRLPCIF